MLAFVFTPGSVVFFGSHCVATGYPIAICINEFDNAQYIFFLVNIVFWFAMVVGIKRLFLDKKKKKTKQKFSKRKS
jgi:hypothetical protein